MLLFYILLHSFQLLYVVIVFYVLTEAFFNFFCFYDVNHQVRLAKLLDGGHVFTKMLGRHEGRAHKMAIEPGNPYILYSCGEDGRVYHVSAFFKISFVLLNFFSYLLFHSLT